MDIGDPFSLKINSPENNKIIYSFLTNFMKESFIKMLRKLYLHIMK